MKVCIDQDMCTGCGLCPGLVPVVFILLDDGLAYVREGERIFDGSEGNPKGREGLAEVPEGLADLVLEAAEDSPGECIYIVQDQIAINSP